MAIKFNRSQTFATGGTVTSAALHNLIDGTDIYPALITDQSALTTVSTADKMLIADTDDTVNAKSVTVQELFDDALSAGTYTNANLTGQLSYGTATGTRMVSTNATITTGTIPTLVSNNATLGTTTGTAATFTNGTVQSLTSSTATITGGTFSGLLNSSTGTFSGLINSTLGTIGTLNSTTGTISNLSTTLAGDLTISQGTATLGTTGVTAGTYGTNTSALTLTLDAKGRVTTVSTSAISLGNNSVTPEMLTQPLTLATPVASTSGTAIDFTGIPSWAKQITVMFSGLSTNGSSVPLIQLGDAGGIETSGYLGAAGFSGATQNSSNYTSGFGFNQAHAAANLYHGAANLCLISAASNLWSYSMTGGYSNLAFIIMGGGSKSLSDTLTQVRITTVNGTDTFDAGSINIMYEG